MDPNIRIIEVQSVNEYVNELSQLLKEVVDLGASIGFLPPLSLVAARHYWENVLEPGVILYVAMKNGKIAGTIQLHLCQKQNGLHRAEIAKLLTHPEYRRNGIARALLKEAEDRAKTEERSLLVLDTREGDPSNRLYISVGYIEAGKIPFYCISENGQLDPTVIYYKYF
ncbi:GNAT family N-acetyltransferase [Robertmurraya kyonggiensis]|uniref:GNAT family N-acetyltransferase n=1 Tax=Robertmurraya kyonggiensis TaxID=1037680 RepID=A0A4U1D8R0_9BACI|nr:GNAT family N-acetyltransferase [Robertmurraya kyonggiensis]TKC18892.1 GNAT family N-acetyltransferase [Robertmurraya kyonggiensis]